MKFQESYTLDSRSIDPTMNTCRDCGNEASSEKPLVTCDHCASVICRSCADLTTTEVRAVNLSKRSILFLCPSCRPLAFASQQAPNDSFFEYLKIELDGLARTLSEAIVTKFESESNVIKNQITFLKDSNVDLIRLLTTPRYRTPPNVSTEADYAMTDATEDQGRNQREELSLHSKHHDVLPGPFLLPTAKQLDEVANQSQTSFRPPVSHPEKPSDKTLPQRAERQRSLRSFSQASNSYRNQRPVVGSNKSGGTKLVAAKILKKTSIFVSRLDINVTSQDLLDYMKGTFGSNENFVIEEQNVRSGDYRSYRVELRVELLDDVLSPSKWPENILLKKFRFFRSRTSTSK